MPWREILIKTPASEIEKVEDLLLELGATCVTLRDAEDQPLLEPAPGEQPLWDEVIAIGLFPAEADLEAVANKLRGRLTWSYPDAVTTCEVPEQDWERAWMADFHPMRFGNRLWVCPSWAEPPDPEGVILRMDPGLAFGTGTHPTTALCLEWLDANPPSDLQVIDYGCGSGVLAIAAVLLGAARCHAVDIDPQALTATRDNAERNGIGEDRLRTSTPEALAGESADLLLANILCGPLLELSAPLARLVRPGGIVVLSGILSGQAQAVRAAYAEWFDMAQPAFRDEWVRLEGVKRRIED
jgi:ribosomal protein L11 methyltransferase